MKKLLTFLILSVFVLSSTNEDLIIDLEQSLMAPCCWSGTVYDHGHSQLENEIQSMVNAGQTRQQVLDHYVGIYGERILAIPVAQGFNIMAWVVPVMIAIAALIIFGLYLRTPKNKDENSTHKTRDSSIPFNDQIEKELQEMD
ncbi:MAG: cytochrome c-type biogenesis protein CcmH [Candidatus Marinimicrobia bacterium]|nr:cytochrome c-type biogenesis protein CcmH [Candidatus Neomarinimicrobiota bacterium]